MAEKQGRGETAQWSTEQLVKFFEDCFAKLKKGTLDPIKASIDQNQETHGRAIQELEKKVSEHEEYLTVLETKVEMMNDRQTRMHEKLEDLADYLLPKGSPAPGPGYLCPMTPLA